MLVEVIGTVLTQRIVAMTCIECGVAFGLAQSFIDERRRDHRVWYCPNRHGQSWTGDNTEEALRKQLASTEQQLRFANSREEAQRRERYAAERSAIAYKGHLTRLRNKIRNGVCPVQGCQRSFQDVRRHIASKHPDWAHEHPEAMTSA